MTLPPYLNTRLDNKNDWAPEMPTEDFALMDIDHGRHFNPLEKINVNMICSKLLELRSSSRELFDQAGTPHAMNVWKGEASS
jgi:hypothetical protein